MSTLKASFTFLKTAEITGVESYLQAIGAPAAQAEEASSDSVTTLSSGEERARWGESANPEGHDGIGRTDGMELGDLSNKAASYFEALADEVGVSSLVKEAFVGAGLRAGGRMLAGAGKGVAKGLGMGAKGVGQAAGAVNRGAGRSRQWMNNASQANQAGTATTAQSLPFRGGSMLNPRFWLGASKTNAGSAATMGAGTALTAGPLVGARNM